MGREANLRPHLGNLMPLYGPSVGPRFPTFGIKEDLQMVLTSQPLVQLQSYNGPDQVGLTANL